MATLQIPSQYTTFQAAYNAAKDGDVIQVAPGRYPRQDLAAGSKKVTFFAAGGQQSGVEIDALWTRANDAVFDGININADRLPRKSTPFQGNGHRAVYKNLQIGNVRDEKAVSADVAGVVFENVRFHDFVMTPTGEAEGVHMEGLYSQSNDITLRRCRFENCAVMDVFFTRGTWWGQPEYGGWVLEDNYFDTPRFTNGQGAHYYAVMWAWQSKYDRAVVKRNTLKTVVVNGGVRGVAAAQDMNGATATFTNSCESGNTPAFNLRGMIQCAVTPPEPDPDPEPEPGTCEEDLAALAAERDALEDQVAALQQAAVVREADIIDLRARLSVAQHDALIYQARAEDLQARIDAAQNILTNGVDA